MTTSESLLMLACLLLLGHFLRAPTHGQVRRGPRPAYQRKPDPPPAPPPMRYGGMRPRHPQARPGAPAPTPPPGPAKASETLYYARPDAPAVGLYARSDAGPDGRPRRRYYVNGQEVGEAAWTAAAQPGQGRILTGRA